MGGIVCSTENVKYHALDDQGLDVRDRLYKGNFDSLDYHTFAGVMTYAKCVNVYDGDTCSLVFYYRGEPIKVHFRMNGYDSPEMKPSLSIPNRDRHIAAAHAAKMYLERVILGRVLYVVFTKEEKYGRLMGDIFLNRDDSMSINSLMINSGHGKEYKGAKKGEFTTAELDRILFSPSS